LFRNKHSLKENRRKSRQADKSTKVTQKYHVSTESKTKRRSKTNINLEKNAELKYET